MPLTTRGLPYPSAFDDPDVPSDLGSLAIALDPYLPPVGMIALTATSAAPTGWLLCEGQTVSRATYGALYAAIGDTYGAGDGSTTFNLPNLKGRVPVGVDAAITSFDTLGETGGALTHQHANTGLTTGAAGGHTHSVDAPLTTTSSDSHSHTAPAHTHTGPSHTHTGPAHTHDFNPNNVSTGSAGSHSHPSLLVVASGGTSTTYAANDTSAGSHTHSVAIGTGTTTTNGNTATGLAGTGATGSAGNSATTSDAHDHTLDIAAFDAATAADHSHARGASDTQSNLQPYIALHYMIKAN